MQSKFSFIKSLHIASPVAFGAMDVTKDQIIYSSGHAEEMLGYSSEELRMHSKNNFESIVHPEDLEHSNNAIKKLLQSSVGEIVEYIARIRKSDGEYLTLLVRDIVFERDHNTPMKYATIVQDISHTVELEKQLEEKLEIIQKISFKNSHDLRAPVANIIAIVALMKEEHFQNEFTAKIFRHLEQTVVKLDKVIREINEISNT